jgi:hypothetical protein
MSLLKKQFIASKEEYRKNNKPQNAYYRIGELLTFKDDTTGKEYHRIKLYLVPDRTFVIFDEKPRE